MNNNCDGKNMAFGRPCNVHQLMQQPSRLQSSQCTSVQWLYPGALIFMLKSLLSHDDHLCLCAARIL